jgi:hypothetical protein
MIMTSNHCLERNEMLAIDDAEGRGSVLCMLAFVALLVSSAAVASPAQCDLRLTVGVALDVPDPRDKGFLSSLLGNHPGYRLTLLRQHNESTIDLYLTGPGPNYRCVNVVKAMREDARVESVKVLQKL